jgi:uncharacterized protein YcbX
MTQRRLVRATEVAPCERCGTPVRTAQYEGGQPRLNEVRTDENGNFRDAPGGHSPMDCTDIRRHGRLTLSTED